MKNPITPENKNNMASTTNGKKQFSDSRLTAAAVFALFPYSGIFGIHNFILKQYGKGVAHIAITAMFFASNIIVDTQSQCIIYSDYSDSCYNDAMMIIAMLLRYSVVVSYIWAAVEGVQILRSKKQNRKVWPVLSIIATIIPIILSAYCFAISSVNANEGGSGAIWWIMVMYYWTLGIPLAIISITFGIIGLKTDLRWLSIVSLLLKAAMIIVIALLLFAHFFQFFQFFAQN